MHSATLVISILMEMVSSKTTKRQDTTMNKQRIKAMPDAQCNLGSLYEDGDGVEQDYDKAKHYYELAADQGYADAQCNLGVLYEDGHGIEQDYEKARNTMS